MLNFPLDFCLVSFLNNLNVSSQEWNQQKYEELIRTFSI